MFSFFKKEVVDPWTEGASIYETIRSKDQQGRLPDDNLPDDEWFWKDQPVRWVAGGIDGVIGHHAGGRGPDQVKVNKTVRLLIQLSRQPSLKTRRAVYLQLMQADVQHMIDSVLDDLRHHPEVHRQNLYNEAFWLAEKGAHRNVVKFGLALLGEFEAEHHRELMMTMGKHDEFTLYAAVVILNSLKEPNATLFELAQSVHGWGRIHTVERLEPETQEIKSWLLREGYQNRIMVEYLAYTCALKGELHHALTAEEVDDALYHGAGEILSALIRGGPAKGMDDYEHAPVVLGEYLRLSQTMCKEMAQLAVILDVLDWLNEAPEVWQDRLANGWTEEMRTLYREAAERILATKDWEDKVRAALRSGDDGLRNSSLRAAKALGLNV